MDTTRLRPDTRALWERVANHPLLKGFVLIGGTALAMRIGHRVSEDLDFAYPAVRLPVGQIKHLLRALGDAGIRFEAADSVADIEQFLDAGMDLQNYQQNFRVNGTVKLSFVAPERETCSVLHPLDARAPLRVATLDEIFATKCLACGDRNKSRDWFDLFVLMRDHGYSARDMHDVFTRVGALPKYEIAAARLRRCQMSGEVGEDPGYDQLLDVAPTVDQMRGYFSDALDALEVDLAEQAFRERAAERPDG